MKPSLRYSIALAPVVLVGLLLGPIPLPPLPPLPPAPGPPSPGPSPPPAPAPPPQQGTGFPSAGAPRFEDLGVGKPAELWGSVDCATPRRHRLLKGRADPNPTATGGDQGNNSFRRLSLRDGDDFYGERCELGLNDHRESPVAVYREGERLLTFLSVRLPRRFPLGAKTWQLAMQMKQTQPSDAGGGSPMLALHVQNGRWRLISRVAVNNGRVWSAEATPGTWTRFAFDTYYTNDPSAGSIKVAVDLNGDQDALDAGEQSPLIRTQTLQTESSGDDEDGVDAGEAIPSHLRVGLYHDPVVRCAPKRRCSIDVDNVGVYEPGSR